MRLPDFIVIGAYKSGTTSLHRQLDRHPRIFMAPKEPNFVAFCDDGSSSRPIPPTAVRSWPEYMRLFERAAADSLVGEVSPEYMVSATAHLRVREAVPEARILAILRNPVERAHSDFLMYVRDGREPCTDFREALRRQGERRRAGLPTGEYVTTGFYGRQLAPWFTAFGAERIHVVLFEDLVGNPRETMGSIHRFLGVDETTGPVDSTPRNVSGVPTNPVVRSAYRLRHRLGPALRPLVPQSIKDRLDAWLARGLAKPPLADDVRAELVEIYRSDIALLEDLIGRDLSHWVQVP